MKKEITIRTRKGLNVELDNTLQPGSYKEIWIFEVIIDGEVEEMCEYDDGCYDLLNELSGSVLKKFKKSAVERFVKTFKENNISKAEYYDFLEMALNQKIIDLVQYNEIIGKM